MNRLVVGISALLLLAGVTISWVAAADDKAEKLFQSRVLPLLKEKCFACHGENVKEWQGNLDLRTRQGMLAGGESDEPAIVPGKPEESPLFLAITREDKVWTAMPPKDNDRLSREQVEYIRQWI